jgi:hypothetical protein
MAGAWVAVAAAFGVAWPDAKLGEGPDASHYDERACDYRGGEDRRLMALARQAR